MSDEDLKLYRELLKQQVEHGSRAALESSNSRDRELLRLSALAIGFSVTVISFMRDRSLIHPCYLTSSWIALGICIVSSIYSMQASSKVFLAYAEYHVTNILKSLGNPNDSLAEEKTLKRIGVLNGWINVLNLLSFISFIVGLILLCMFMNENLLRG